MYQLKNYSSELGMSTTHEHDEPSGKPPDTPSVGTFTGMSAAELVSHARASAASVQSSDSLDQASDKSQSDAKFMTDKV